MDNAAPEETNVQKQPGCWFGCAMVAASLLLLCLAAYVFFRAGMAWLFGGAGA